MYRFIENIGEYFASNFFDESFKQKVIAKASIGEEEKKDIEKALHGLKEKYYRFKQTLLEGGLRTKDKIQEAHSFHSLLLRALGYVEAAPAYERLYHLKDKEVVPVRQVYYRGGRPQLFVMEMKPMIREGEAEPEGLFEQRWHQAQWEALFEIKPEERLQGIALTPSVVNEAISQVFALPEDRRPHFILVMAGSEYYLLHFDKWFRGSYLRFSIEDLFDEATARFRDYYLLFYCLVGKAALAPEGEIILMDQLDEDSHKSAYAVTKDLKEGVIHAVEALANEALSYMQQRPSAFPKLQAEDGNLDLRKLDARQLKDDCLTMVYRLLFLFYAESREELNILPVNDEVYERGYSMDMLRDLELVRLTSDASRNGYFFHASLSALFGLLSHGHHTGADRIQNKSFSTRRLDSPLFDPAKFHYLAEVQFRNVVWQDIICRLSLSKQQKGRNRGRISYANLGINQLGSVYESLLAFRGIFAETDMIEVHRAGKPEEGTFLVARSRRDDFQADEVLHDEESHKEIIIPKGSFVYRLSGRDRQKSASYYTPEVLTRTTVKYTLKGFVEQLEKGEMKASELLQFKILEPAMGAAAFHNEAINQIADAYLSHRQKELNARINPGLYREELQKVKAYIATHNVYGVDLNPTAVELGKLSLWLNVIHKDMQPPFFGHRLGVGNAVMGAWFRTYPKKALVQEKVEGTQRMKADKKEWWTKAPQPVEWTNTGVKRKADEIYHFLLPDEGMVPSAGLSLLKTEFEREVKQVREWKKEFKKPLTELEYQTLLGLSRSIDALIAEHYALTRQIALRTADLIQVWGQEGQQLLELSFDQKQELQDLRLKQAAPYFKLKLILDYWCALWCWDVRKADDLPENRGAWWQDVRSIIDLDAASLAGDGVNASVSRIGSAGVQGNLFDASRQLSLAEQEAYRKADASNVTLDQLAASTERGSLFDDRERLRIVRSLSVQYRFFHYHLEFVEVFVERGGFDVIVGNPPWVKVEFEEGGIVSEWRPEVWVRKMTTPETRPILESLQSNENFMQDYCGDAIIGSSSSQFLSANCNFPLIKGQQTNLYKCIVENGFLQLAKFGFMGLIHPEGIYDDPNGKHLRLMLYPRLKFHFQFKNELGLFSEVHHEVLFGVHIYQGISNSIRFHSIHNLFHPSTIEGSFVHDGNGECGGYKIQDPDKGSMTWNIKPHRNRVVSIQESELRILARTFENTDEWESCKLVSIHSRQILGILEKLSQFEGKVGSVKYKVSEGFHETNAANLGIIKRKTQAPDYDEFQMIYCGPNFFVGNPFYKTPRVVCKLNSDYDEIDLESIPENFLPRTNYIPAEGLETFKKRNSGLKILGFDENKKPIFDYQVDYNKVLLRTMLYQTGERTLIASLVPPKVSNIGTATFLIFEKDSSLLEFLGLSVSLLVDFYIKTLGVPKIGYNIIANLPLGIPQEFRVRLIIRTLLISCLVTPYSAIWETSFDPNFASEIWSKNDSRLKQFKSLSPQWAWETPLRNAFERRQALVEIDVISSMALGLSLEELILIYNIQFPVLQQNEDDTWYDAKGNIVFTCSKGLTGVGLSRSEWNAQRGEPLQAGERYTRYGPAREWREPGAGISREGVVPVEECTYDGPAGMVYRGPASGAITHIIDPKKSELYGGQERTYYAPFDRCDRVADYRRAWAFFEKLIVPS